MLLTQAGKNNLVYILYRKSLSGTFSSRWLQLQQNSYGRAVQQQMAKEGSYLAPLLLPFLVYFTLAVLAFTKKQILSLTILEGSLFNHPPSASKENLESLCEGCVLFSSPFTGSSLWGTGSAYSSWLGAVQCVLAWCSRCCQYSSLLPQTAPGPIPLAGCCLV